MTDSNGPMRGELLAIFENAFSRITEKGARHDAPDGCADTRRLSMIAAWTSEQSRSLGAVCANGSVKPFAMVNGKGYVEPQGGLDESGMEAILRHSASRVERTTPCTGEGSMYHFSTRGPTKVF